MKNNILESLLQSFYILKEELISDNFMSKSTITLERSTNFDWFFGKGYIVDLEYTEFNLWCLFMYIIIGNYIECIGLITDILENFNLISPAYLTVTQLEFFKLYSLCGFSLEISLLILYLTYTLSPQLLTEEKQLRYECGFDPFNDSRGGFDIHYYLVAILFIIFDLEIIFLFPWAASLTDLIFNLDQIYLTENYVKNLQIKYEDSYDTISYYFYSHDIETLYSIRYKQFLNSYYETYWLYYINVKDYIYITEMSGMITLISYIFILVFLLILILGFAYEWNKSALQW